MQQNSDTENIQQLKQRSFCTSMRILRFGFDSFINRSQKLLKVDIGKEIRAMQINIITEL